MSLPVLHKLGDAHTKAELLMRFLTLCRLEILDNHCSLSLFLEVEKPHSISALFSSAVASGEERNDGFGRSRSL